MLKGVEHALDDCCDFNNLVGIGDVNSDLFRWSDSHSLGAGRHLYLASDHLRT